MFDHELALHSRFQPPLGLRRPRRSHASPRSRRDAHPHRAPLQRVGGRRRVQRGPRPAPLLRPARRRRHRARRQSRRPSRRGLHPRRRRRHFSYPLGSVRWRRPHRAQRPQLYRARLWPARRRRLLGPRPHRHQPGQAGRLRLGVDLRPDEWLALDAYRRNLRRALRFHRRGRRRSHGRRAQILDAHLLRPELPRLALEIHRRQGQGAGGQSRPRRQGRRAPRQRGRFLRHARHRHQGRRARTSPSCPLPVTRRCCARLQPLIPTSSS